MGRKLWLISLFKITLGVPTPVSQFFVDYLYQCYIAGGFLVLFGGKLSCSTKTLAARLGMLRV